MYRRNGKGIKFVLILISLVIFITLFLPILKLNTVNGEISESGLDIIKTFFAGDREMGLFSGDTEAQIYLQEYLKTDGYTILTETFMYAYLGLLGFGAIIFIFCILYFINALFPPDIIHLIFACLYAAFGIVFFAYTCVMSKVQTDAITSAFLSIGAFVTLLPIAYIPLFVKSAYYY